MAVNRDTVVIGGGQSGLAMSYVLKQRGIEHVVLEKERIGESWRSGRWDSFTLVSPNWTMRLPGFPYAGNEPDGFLPRDEIVAHLEAYAASFGAPVRSGIKVNSVEAEGNGYLVRTGNGDYSARSVVIATGLFQQPKLPSFSREINPEIIQMHTGQYRNPNMLPPGAVLVVGSGQSGCQIAEELYRSGRKVYLVVGSAGRVPRRYRGQDAFRWLLQSGFFDTPIDKAPTPKVRYAGNPHMTGKDGGHSINLHRFAQDGVTLLGRIQGAESDRIHLAPDLNATMAKVDQFAADIIKLFDETIEKQGLDVPEDLEVRAEELAEHEPLPETTELNLRDADITSIVWAMGYRFDFSWVKLPVFDEDGYPVQARGVTTQPGLYFLGLHFLHTRKSGLFLGVGDDAAHVAEHLSAHLGK